MDLIEKAKKYRIYETRGMGDSHDPHQRVKIDFSRASCEQECKEFHSEIGKIMEHVTISVPGYNTLNLSATHFGWESGRNGKVTMRPMNNENRIFLAHVSPRSGYLVSSGPESMRLHRGDMDNYSSCEIFYEANKSD